MVKSLIAKSRSKVKMSRKTSRTLLIISLVSIFLCACPGLALLIPGIDALADLVAMNPAADQAGYARGLLVSGGLICLSAALILIPVILLLVWLFTRKSKKPYDPLEPTGASSDDPIPPTS
jgi:uncharacterized SAM-binding protein YcdF (DUF218 family)